jgi:hypothetical protein
MKTVTLTDHAYERLAARQLPRLSAKQARTLGKECCAHRSPQRFAK